MRGAVLYGPGDIRVEQRPDPVITAPTDAIITCIGHQQSGGTPSWLVAAGPRPKCRSMSRSFPASLAVSFPGGQGWPCARSNALAGTT